MSDSQIAKLKELGINPNKEFLEIFEDLLNVTIHLSEINKKTEEVRFREALYMHKKFTN